MPENNRETFKSLHYDEAIDKFEKLVCEFGHVKDFDNASDEAHEMVRKKYPFLALHADEQYASYEARRAIKKRMKAKAKEMNDRITASRGKR